MYCTHCGKEIADDQQVCPYCGQKTIAYKEENSSNSAGKNNGFNQSNPNNGYNNFNGNGGYNHCPDLICKNNQLLLPGIFYTFPRKFPAPEPDGA